jgi:hypothetical protein
MRLIEVEPRKIWPFQPDVGVSKNLLEIVQRGGWKNVKRVPIFEIPNVLVKDGFEYLLIDGHHRRSVAEYLGCLLPCACFEPGERVDVVKFNLAGFRHENDPKLYHKLLGAYGFREPPVGSC